MGCGGSVAKKKSLQEELDASERDLSEERRKLQEKDEQFARLNQSLMEHMQGLGEASDARRDSQTLRSELEERRRRHEVELREQREEHSIELHSRLQQERDAALSRDNEAREALEQAQRASVRQEAAAADAARYQRDAEHAEREVRRLRDQFGPLRREHDEAAEDLYEARRLLQTEQAERSSSAGLFAGAERRLAEAQEEHSREKQRIVDLETHLRAQMRDLQGELREREEELSQRDCLLQQRDHELAEVNSQLSDLQGLFDDVNQQLQGECGRIEKLQETVSLCAKQSKELEQLQGMLEDSHRVLAQVQKALASERSERARTAGLLEHEQQRTQLLLDVLKHFKEKLQGLTPQMLLSKLACLDPKALASLGGNAAGLPGNLASVASLEGLWRADPFAASGVGSPRCGTSDGAASTGVATADTGLLAFGGAIGGSTFCTGPIPSGATNAGTPSPTETFHCAPSPGGLVARSAFEQQYHHRAQESPMMFSGSGATHPAIHTGPLSGRA